MTFAVVEFMEDKSVDIIPLVWLADDETSFWPPYQALRLSAAVRKCEMLMATAGRNAEFKYWDIMVCI